MRTLEKIHTGYSKSGRDAAKPIAAILRESKGKQTLDATTIGKHLTHLKECFAACVRHHRFSTADDVEAMFGDIRLDEAVPPAKERELWPLPKLAALFSSPV